MDSVLCCYNLREARSHQTRYFLADCPSVVVASSGFVQRITASNALRVPLRRQQASP